MGIRRAVALGLRALAQKIDPPEAPAEELTTEGILGAIKVIENNFMPKDKAVMVDGQGRPTAIIDLAAGAAIFISKENREAFRGVFDLAGNRLPRRPSGPPRNDNTKAGRYG